MTMIIDWKHACRCRMYDRFSTHWSKNSVRSTGKCIVVKRIAPEMNDPMAMFIWGYMRDTTCDAGTCRTLPTESGPIGVCVASTVPL